MNLKGLAFALFLLLSFLAPCPGEAATFVVNQGEDGVDANPGDGVCVRANGGCSLRAAIQEANALGGTHTIVLSARFLSLTIPGRDEHFAATGDLNVRSNLTIIGQYLPYPQGRNGIHGRWHDRIFHVEPGYELTLSDVNLSEGDATASGSCEGGGIRVNAAVLVVNRASVHGMHGCDGGAIAVVDPLGLGGARAQLVDVSLGYNTAGDAGGGLYLASGATAEIRGAEITGNEASRGGGIWTGAAALSLGNTTVSHNDAESGGAITTATGSATTLANVTFAQNSARNASLVSAGSITAVNTIVAHSGSPAGSCLRDGSGSITSNGHNIEFPGATCGFGRTTDRLADPRLMPDSRQGYGGGPLYPKTYYSLLSGSPALDAGDDASCAAAPVFNVDQRGFRRPLGSRCDIGAYEAPAVPFDFDGDRRADIGVYREATGEWFIRLSADGGVLHQAWGSRAHQDQPVAADYDGDARTDIAVYRRSTGEWFIRLTGDGQSRLVHWGAPGLDDVPVPSDYDGDGRADIAIYRKSTGEWFIHRSTDGAIFHRAWGSASANHFPIPADYDADGKADLAVFSRASGSWSVLRSTDATTWQVGWGDPNQDVPLRSDPQNGESSPRVFRWSTGEWATWTPPPLVPCSPSRCPGGYPKWGNAALGDVPVPANYGGDGSGRIAVYRRGTGEWFIAATGFNGPIRWGSADPALNDLPINLPAPLW